MDKADIYDRSAWPPAEANPLVRLLLADDEWIGNHELADALGLVAGPKGNKSVVGHWKNVLVELGPNNTKLQRLPFEGNRGTQTRRFFSKKALVLVGMRTRSPNAAAFREWLADRVVKGLDHG